MYSTHRHVLFLKKVSATLFVLPIVWLGMYLTWGSLQAFISFETHYRKVQATVIDASIGQKCSQPSGGKMQTCAQVLNIEYSFVDESGESRIDHETIDFWFKSEEKFAAELRNSTRDIIYDSQDPRESTLFPARHRVGQIFNVLFPALLLLGGFVGLFYIYQPQKK